ncbi:hypothetical protein PoB_007155800 [Plakobranchus ocellatus]|uniref:Uncharacterized protein n=1 Tax=Plakobranchus ocellatus TaxID=259542 RepID=A0AAV4DLX8_9GAST|nr:hypothetical protein PoB_007155800 [Plakobranchus ocellatus]
MATAQSTPLAAKAKHREPSEEAHQVVTLKPPAPRQIPLPEFYPTERTSTASFKAPITSAKKAMKPPPPPPASALNSAISYLSSPVRYFSSIFTTPPPPPPEPVKVKERLFKIDIEREKEKNSPTKISNTVKKVQNNATGDEIIPSPKLAVMAEKNQGSAWRRKNITEIGFYSPPSPKTQKYRTQSPKRIIPSPVPPMGLSPTNVNQLTIASSSLHNSFRVMSKNQPEEVDKKKKKDLRKLTNGRPSSKEPPVSVNNNKVKSNKYNAALSNRLNVPSSLDYPPTFPYPTVLPPRVPPATYKIKSADKAASLDDEYSKDKELSEANELENAASSAIATASDKPELVSHQSPTQIHVIKAGGAEDSLHLNDDDDDPQIQETLGIVNIGDVIRVSRLDQLPSNRLRGFGKTNGLQNIIHDATLMNNITANVSENAVLSVGKDEPIKTILCSSSTRHSSPGKVSAKTSDQKKPVTSTASTAKKRISSPSKSPLKKARSPMSAEVGTETKQPQVEATSKKQSSVTNIKSQPLWSTPQTNVVEATTKKQSSVTKSQPLWSTPQTNVVEATSKKQSSVTNIKSQPLWSTPQTTVLKKSTETAVDKESLKNGAPSKSPPYKKSPSPVSKEPFKKVSPLRVEDKYVKAVAESLSMSPGKTSKKDDGTQQTKQSSSSLRSPLIIKKSVSKSKDVPPEKPAPSRDPVLAAAAAAASAAAIGAVTSATTSILQKQLDQEKDGSAAPPVQSDPDKMGPSKQRSPTSARKAEKDRAGIVSGPLIQPPISNSSGDEASLHAGDKAKHDNAKSSAKGLFKKGLVPEEGRNKDNLGVQDTGFEIAARGNIAQDDEEYNCVENYCGDPTKFFKAATMMGEIP